ncbi:hypothetical protein MKW92_049160 [Papaver armeniacum]|nr:hypothetical protein MKW92_049160 [Papaver armeniacum]
MEEQKPDIKSGLVLVIDVENGFDLEKSVCSHGLFMMPPNVWNPETKSLERPLRLLSDPSTSLTVHISSSHSSSSCLHVHVLDTLALSKQDEQHLLSQVSRMLRLSENEEINVREFQKMHLEAKLRGFGRVFRSPSLFEDMVKCILLCNCQWPRTLAMARALCELQLKLKPQVVAGAASSKASAEHFLPKTPNVREKKRKHVMNEIGQIDFGSNSSKGEVELDEKICEEEQDGSYEYCNPCETLKESRIEGFKCGIGDFPSAAELANLDDQFLAKQCGLGYRAARIVKLAQSIVEGKLQLEKLEEEIVSAGAVPSVYDKLASQLSKIYGFGNFTCANVLMCMGFYQVIPTDSETIRHLKKVHRINCINRTVQSAVEKVYDKYKPFQFLAYWSEVWHFYEETFGKTSEMPHSDYQLITAHNMRANKKKNGKGTKNRM